MADETRVHGEPLERWTITVPRQGPPGHEIIQGTPVYNFHLAPEWGDRLEDSLRRVNGSTVRRGVPFIYRGERQLDPDKGAAEEDRLVSAAMTSAQDPVDAANTYEVLQLRDLRRQLLLELDAKRKELDSLNKAIEEARGRLVKETAASDAAVAEVLASNQRLMDDARAHHQKQLRRQWQTEAELEQRSTDGLQQLGTQIDIATTARKQIDRVMRADTLAEWFSGAKEVVTAVANSPPGQAVSMQIAAKIAGTVNRRMEEKGQTVKPLHAGGKPGMEEADALVAFMCQGRAWRVRLESLRELRLLRKSSLAEAATLGGEFLSGAIELRVLTDFLGRPLSPV